MNLEAFLGEFKAEALEHLQKLDSGLLAFERDPKNAQLVRQLFLSAHTIKGGASMLELKVLKVFTHAFEDVLGRLRDHGETLDSSTATLLFSALDQIRLLVVDQPTLTVIPPEVAAMIGQLKARASGQSVTVEPAPVEPALTAPNQVRIAVVLEPSATARAVMTAQLEGAGWQVNGVESIEQAEAQALEAQLIVLPLEPPGLDHSIDGLALAKAWLELGLKARLIVTALEFNAEQAALAEHLKITVRIKPSMQDSSWLEVLA
jgi:chemotaxis protein histidine kinase CheA